MRHRRLDRLSLLVCLGAALLAPVAAAAQADLAPAERARTGYGRLVPEVLTGEVLVKTYHNEVVVAVDEAGPDGQGDGRVDHLFAFTMLVPDIVPSSFWDPAAEIELRPTGLHLFAHTQQREIELLMYGVPPALRPKASLYSHRVFEAGLHLYRYSGAVVGEVSLTEVEQRGREIFTSLRQREKQIIAQHPEPPDPEAGGTCQSSCSTRGCNAGACSAACLPGYCAKCSCVGDPPPTYPSCFCAPK